MNSSGREGINCKVGGEVDKTDAEVDAYVIMGGTALLETRIRHYLAPKSANELEGKARQP